MRRKMEITSIVDSKTRASRSPMAEFLDQMNKLREVSDLIDVEQSLIDIYHDLASDCECEGCKAFETLRKTLRETHACGP